MLGGSSPATRAASCPVSTDTGNEICHHRTGASLVLNRSSAASPMLVLSMGGRNRRRQPSTKAEATAGPSSAAITSTLGVHPRRPDAHAKFRGDIADPIRQHLAVGRLHIGHADADGRIPPSQSGAGRRRRDPLDELLRRLARRTPLDRDVLKIHWRRRGRGILRLDAGCEKSGQERAGQGHGDQPLKAKRARIADPSSFTEDCDTTAS